MANKRSLLLYMEDILVSIQNIENYVNDITEQEFRTNQEKQDAVIRRLEIIGEAVKKIPENIRGKYTEVPWRQISGMRDVVIHEYFGVSSPLIYKTATSDLSLLKEAIIKLIEKKSDETS